MANLIDMRSNSIKVLTYQSPEVYHQLIANGSYVADAGLAREHNIYTDDFAYGLAPIYVYTNHDTYRFLSGITFQDMAEEMSIPKRELSNKVLLELQVSADRLKPATVHNDCQHVKVLHRISTFDLAGAYITHFDLDFYMAEIECLYLTDRSVINTNMPCGEFETDRRIEAINKCLVEGSNAYYVSSLNQI